jgi:hypothetical protein
MNSWLDARRLRVVRISGPAEPIEGGDMAAEMGRAQLGKSGFAGNRASADYCVTALPMTIYFNRDGDHDHNGMMFTDGECPDPEIY